MGKYVPNYKPGQCYTQHQTAESPFLVTARSHVCLVFCYDSSSSSTAALLSLRILHIPSGPSFISHNKSRALSAIRKTRRPQRTAISVSLSLCPVQLDCIPHYEPLNGHNSLIVSNCLHNASCLVLYPYNQHLPKRHVPEQVNKYKWLKERCSH